VCALQPDPAAGLCGAFASDRQHKARQPRNTAHARGVSVCVSGRGSMGVALVSRVHSANCQQRQSERGENRDAERQPEGSHTTTTAQTRRQMHMRILARSYTQKLWMRVKRKAAYLPG